jgi:hypothetical protein
MKRNLLVCILLVFTTGTFAQSFGFWASAVAMKVNSPNLTYYDTYDTTDVNRFPNVVFSDDVPSYYYLNFDTTLGTFAQNSGSLQINGGIIKTFKNTNSNVCGTTLYYTVYPQGSRPASPVFSPINFSFFSNCLGSTFPYDGSACGAGDQEWGDTSTITGTDLTTFAPGNYTMEVYFQVPGDSTSTSDCSETAYDNNSNPATNYQANFTIVSNPVALNLLSFSGIYQKDAVALNWSDANELNTRGFEIERSTDGKNFIALSFVNAKGNIAATNSYSFSDNNLPVAAKLFYRLEMVDNSGKYTYSSIIAVNLNTVNSFSAQLTKDNLAVYLNTPIGNNSFIRLTDLLGRTITERNLSAQSAGSTISLPLSESTVHGVYIVSLFDGATGNTINKRAELSY